MPYDPMGSSFGRWSRGGTAPGLRSIYGYNDQGAMYSPQNPNPAPSPPAMQPNVGMTQINPQGDFFTQLAGLMGGSPTQPSQKPLSPAQYNYNQALYGNSDAMAQSAASHVMLSPTYGGRGAFSGQPVQYGAGGGIINPYSGKQNFQMGTGGAYGSASAPTQGAGGNSQPTTQRFLAGDNSPNRPVPGQSMPKPGRPMAAPAGRAPGLMAGNSPMLGEKNPLDGMPSNRRMPSRTSGRASMGRTATRMPSRATFNYQMGGNG